MYITCPSCRATLEPDEIDRTRRECPICLASLADVDLSEFEDQLGDESDYIASHSQPTRQSVASHTDSGSNESKFESVEIIEETADRLVAHIPPTTSGSGGIGIFTLMWNGFMTVFTTIMVTGMRKNAGQTETIPLLFIGVFWLVGISLVVLWVRMRFTRLYLLMEKDRLVVQTKLFGTSNRELPLGPATRATLEESYSVNNVPVYRISVVGLGRSESFGTGLPSGDKEQLCQRINAFLGVNLTTLTTSKDDRVCAHCGVNIGQATPKETDADQSLCEACQQQVNQNPSGTLWPPLRAGGAEELPANLEVDDSNPDQVLIRYPLLPSSSSTGFMKLIVVAATVAVMGFIAVGMRHAIDLPEGIFSVLLLLLGTAKLLAGAGILLILIRGQIQITMTKEAINMRWGWGPLAFKKLILPETITACQIVRSSPSQINKGNTRRAAASPVGFAGIKVGDAAYPLVTIHGIEYGQKVIRLVRTYLKQLSGQELSG